MEQDQSIEGILQEALRQHRAGQLIEAARLYEQILTLDARHADSLHLLGMIAHQAGKTDLAIDLIQRAIAQNPQSADYYSNLGTVYQARGAFDAATEQYLHALKLKPGQAETYGNLGSVLLAQGKLDTAIGCYQRAIALTPHQAELHFHLGNAFYGAGKLDEAVNCFEQAIALQPTYAEAHCNLGNALLAQGHVQEAVSRLQAALMLAPHLAEAHNGMGNAVAACKLYENARELYERALAIKPDYAEAYSNYGTLLEAQGKLAEAVEKHRQSLRFNPDSAEAHNSLGNALGALGQLEEAVAHFHRALALKPELTEARYNLGMVQLCAGDFAAGWMNYEWRWHADKSPLHKPPFLQPQWQGEPLHGARILLHAEQGLGDTLQFLRFVPMVQAAGGSVVLMVQKRLHRIAAELPGLADVVSPHDPLPEFAWHCPLLSLPLAFGTTLGTIPAQTPYLSVPEEAHQKMKALPWPSEGLRVGLVWAGNRTHLHDRARYRSIPLPLLKPLFEQEGIHWFSLQIGEAVHELGNAPGAIADLSASVSDMADTAAQIAQLDLVITVDTSVAHLAGALGAATWLLLPLAAEWRWMRARSDSPWYPTLRLFRQPAPGDWEPVVEAVRRALLAFAAGQAAKS